MELSNYDENEDEVRQKINEIQGTSKTYMDDVFTILEMHVDLDLEGFEDMSPGGRAIQVLRSSIYCIHRTRVLGDILSIRRNFEEGTGLA